MATTKTFCNEILKDFDTIIRDTYIGKDIVIKEFPDKETLDDNVKKTIVLSDLGIGPDYKYAIICEDEKGKDRYFMAIEKLYKTLREVAYENDGVLPKKYMKKLIDLYVKAYSNELNYEDNKDDNIMIDKKGNLYFIDTDGLNYITNSKFKENKNQNIINTAYILYLSGKNSFITRSKMNNKKDLKKELEKVFNNKYGIDVVELKKNNVETISKKILKETINLRLFRRLKNKEKIKETKDKIKELEKLLDNNIKFIV